MQFECGVGYTPRRLTPGGIHTEGLIKNSNISAKSKNNSKMPFCHWPRWVRITKNRGQKSRDTLPLISNVHVISTFVGIFLEVIKDEK